MVNQELLNDTLQKINASLNKRFEKDADLYISRQDEIDMKKHLCNGAYGAVADMAKVKGISNDIVVKVILRSASVIYMTDQDLKQFKKELNPILAGADYSVLEHMMEDVFNNHVYIQKGLRHIMFRYYVNKISAEKCLQYWNSEQFSFDSQEQKTLYEFILKKSRDTVSLCSMDAKIAFMNSAFDRYPTLLTDRNVIIRLGKLLEDSDKEPFFKYLCREMQGPSINDDRYVLALSNAYASYGMDAFRDAVFRIKSGSPAQYKEYIKAIRSLFEQETDLDTQISMFDTLYQAYDAPYMKTHIKRVVVNKIWLPIKERKPALYEARRARLNQLLDGMEQDGQDNRYTSFDEVVRDIQAGINLKSIAYLWRNMRSPAFEESLELSFTQLDPRELKAVREIYRWLFRHSLNMGGTKPLEDLCEKIALVLRQTAERLGQSEFFKALDALWLEYVIDNKPQGKNIEDYMFEAHFAKAREWKQ